MAKKKAVPAFPSLERDDQEWGTRLLLRPFPGDDYRMMEVQADIEKPTEARKLTVVKIRFTGVPMQHPFNAAQARIWLHAVQTVADQAKAIEDEFKKKSPAHRGAKKTH